MRRSGIGELRVRETDALQVREVFANLLQAFVIDAAAAEAALDQVCPAFESCKRMPRHRRTNEGESLHVLQSGKLFQSRVRKLPIVCETQRLQLREAGDGRYPTVAELGGDDV